MAPPRPDDASARRVPVWDLPTRLFHWGLVVLVVVSIYTGNVGGLSEMEWHMRAGYAVLALLLFRLGWGVIGSRHARFADFVRGPRAVLAYARALLGGRAPFSLGHNPVGGWSVLAMLAALLVQAVTGLFANDDILTEGPLVRHVSRAFSNQMTAIHDLNAKLIYALIALHLAAIVFHLLVKKENLTAAMLSGRKRLPADAAAPLASGGFVGIWRAVLLLALAVAAVAVVVTL